MYVCMDVYVCMYVCMYVCISVCMDVCMDVWMYGRIDVWMYGFVWMCSRGLLPDRSHSLWLHNVSTPSPATGRFRRTVMSTNNMDVAYLLFAHVWRSRIDPVWDLGGSSSWGIL